VAVRQTSSYVLCRYRHIRNKSIEQQARASCMHGAYKSGGRGGEFTRIRPSANCPPNLQKNLPLGIHQNTPFQGKNRFFLYRGLASPRPRCIPHSDHLQHANLLDLSLRRSPRKIPAMPMAVCGFCYTRRSTNIMHCREHAISPGA